MHRVLHLDIIFEDFHMKNEQKVLINLITTVPLHIKACQMQLKCFTKRMVIKQS